MFNEKMFESLDCSAGSCKNDQCAMDDATRTFSKIACYIIIQSIRDYYGPEIEYSDDMKSFKKREYLRQIKLQGEASCWLQGKSLDGEKDDSLFSLENCCNFINSFISKYEKSFPYLSPQLIRKFADGEKQMPKSSRSILRVIAESEKSKNKNELYDECSVDLFDAKINLDHFEVDTCA